MKLPFGHHGANHPVKDLTTGAIEITSQNHNFAVDARLAGRRRRADPRQPQRRRVRGARRRDADAFSVQHHPEAGPGPHDSSYLFARFAERMVSPAAAARRRPRRGCRCRPTSPIGLPAPADGVA